MVARLSTWLLALVLGVFVFDGVGADARRGKNSRGQKPLSRNMASFESGNIGRIVKVGPLAYDLHLRSDNDETLPKYWRQWFYLKIDDMPVGKPVTLTIKGQGHWNYYLPVYSYDGKTWQQFSEREVKQPTRLTTRLKKTFNQKTVWLARYNPYTYTDLRAWIDTLKPKPGVTVGSIGQTPQGRDIPLLTITDPAVPDATKAHIVVHARTHPGEVGCSFMLEGLVNELTAETGSAQRMREAFVYTIVPMLNVDGVVAGNNRVSPQGINLEGKWYGKSGSPLELDETRAPHEVKLMHRMIRGLALAKANITTALNLHASNGAPEDNVFFFPHFGPARRGYNAAESRLYRKQIDFIKTLTRIHGPAWFNQPARDGTRAFLKKSVPESWWWRNFKDKVMALSVESTYGRAANLRRWMTPDDMRRIGASIARAIDAQHPHRSKNVATINAASANRSTSSRGSRDKR